MPMRVHRFFFILVPFFILSACVTRPAPMGVPDSPFGTPPTRVIETQPVPVGRAGQDHVLPSHDAQNGVIDPFSNPSATQPADRVGQVSKVGLLLPLTGQHAQVGNAMLQAAQLALFDMGEGRMQLLPKDTKGTSVGGASAAQAAIDEGAQLIIGPLFSQAVSGASPVARRGSVALIGFSTDRTVAGAGSYIMGVLPEGQAERMADYAATQGYKHVGIVAASDAYGRLSADAFRSRASSRAVRITQAMNTQNLETVLSPDIQAIFLPMGGQMAVQIATRIKQQRPDIALLGTGLWDDDQLVSNAVMGGAVYAAPSPRLRRNFENKYRNLYGSNPPRIASIAYDATALSVVLSRQKPIVSNTARVSMRPSSFASSAITNPSGFSGIDGIFRFRPDGTAQRGLAVLSIRNGQALTREGAPSSFAREY